MTKNSKLHFEQIVGENKAAIFRICKAYLGMSDEVNDLYQEVLINVWKSLPRFKGQAKLSTWIYRITVNTAITFNRKRQRHNSRNVVLDDLSFLDSDDSARNEKIKLEEDLNRMLEVINTLDKDQRIIIGLYLEDLSYKEIAEVVGRDTNYIGVKITRIKEKLAKRMIHERVG